MILCLTLDISLVLRLTLDIFLKPLFCLVFVVMHNLQEFFLLHRRTALFFSRPESSGEAPCVQACDSERSAEAARLSALHWQPSNGLVQASSAAVTLPFWQHLADQHNWRQRDEQLPCRHCISAIEAWSCTFPPSFLTTFQGKNLLWIHKNPKRNV